MYIPNIDNELVGGQTAILFDQLYIYIYTMYPSQ